ncbi:MAG: SAM-dependent methyltransferase [Elusimicrobiota bacterium]|jgi:adenine-specific DNA-methyltransferase|nr:SAM-dependent methyltransferase [Elusimicrobiota bacterium]
MTDIKKIKQNGKVYTPQYIVNNMLDFVGYTDDNILSKHIVDNSCGDGAFLTQIVDRYCRAFLRNNSNKLNLKKNLEKYIHGIEIEQEEAQNCKTNLNKVAQKFKIKNTNWNIICGDSLEISDFNGKMDFVVGNPPYVRVHNLIDSYDKVKSFQFAGAGMTDLYIVFFEIGFNMLNQTGKMCLISPSSFFRSKSGSVLRSHIKRKRCLSKVIDLEHFQPFEAAAYTAITMFDNNKHTDIDYYVYDGLSKSPRYIERLSYDDFFIDNKIVLSNKKQLSMLLNIEDYYKNSSPREIVVKNGFATLADAAFIGDIDINDEFVIDIIKASTGKWKKCIFPYLCNGKPISEIDLQKKHKAVYNYLLNQKELLLKRDILNRGDWFLFGRTQGINDVFRYKIAVNSIIKDIASIKINEIPSGSAVYSGLYILSPYTFHDIQSALLSQDFIDYLKLLKNYKSGGYYTMSSLELEKYLTYKIQGAIYEQQELFRKVN